MLDKTIFTTTILLLQTAAKHRVLLNGVLLEESSLAPDELLSLLPTGSCSSQLLTWDIPYG